MLTVLTQRPPFLSGNWDESYWRGPSRPLWRSAAAVLCGRVSSARSTSRTINQAGCEDGGHVSSRALKAIKPDYLIPLHCSGDRFREIAKAEMPQNFIRTSVGTRLVFGT
jgi:hypothetical protein